MTAAHPDSGPDSMDRLGVRRLRTLREVAGRIEGLAFDHELARAQPGHGSQNGETQRAFGMACRAEPCVKPVEKQTKTRAEAEPKQAHAG